MPRRVLRGFDRAAFVAVRRSRGLSVPELARFTRIGMSTIHAWEAGTRRPQVDFLTRVMRTLDTPIAEVVRIDPQQRYPGDWRVLAGLTQPELAAAAKISTLSLRYIERADTTLTDAVARRLSHALGISTGEYWAAYERARIRPPGTPA